MNITVPPINCKTMDPALCSICIKTHYFRKYCKLFALASCPGKYAVKLLCILYLVLNIYHFCLDPKVKNQFIAFGYSEQMMIFL